MVVTDFGVSSFSHSFPFVIEIKCKTVELVVRGNRRHIYPKHSQGKKGNLVLNYAVLLSEKVLRGGDLITGPGLRVRHCVMELLQLTVQLQ